MTLEIFIFSFCFVSARPAGTATIIETEPSKGCSGFGPLCGSPELEAITDCYGKNCDRKIHHFCVTESYYHTYAQRNADQGKALCFKCATGEEPSDHPKVPLRCSDPKGEDDLLVEDGKKNKTEKPAPGQPGYAKRGARGRQT